MRPILRIGNPILSQRCERVTEFGEIRELADEMFRSMRSVDGLGLAAPQIGESRRVIVIDGDLIEPGLGEIVLCNPEVVSESGIQSQLEACLSIPGMRFATTRPMTVVVSAQDKDGKPVAISGAGLLAVALCHEIDHLDGILISDIKLENPPR